MQRLFEKLKAAIEADPEVIVPKDKLGESEGYNLAYWDVLGLSKTDMKKLERKGLAIRGYTPRGSKSKLFPWEPHKAYRLFRDKTGELHKFEVLKHSGFETRFILILP